MLKNNIFISPRWLIKRYCAATVFGNSLIVAHIDILCNIYYNRTMIPSSSLPQSAEDRHSDQPHPISVGVNSLSVSQDYNSHQREPDTDQSQLDVPLEDIPAFASFLESRAVDPEQQIYSLESRLPIDPSAVVRAIARTIGKTTQEKDLLQEARHNPVTGLLNKAGLYVEAGRRGVEKRGMKLAEGHGVMAFDLAGLKMINDTKGHDEGNKALIATAKALMAPRVAGEQSSWMCGAYHIGGDEFWLIYDTEYVDSPVQMFDRIQGEFKQQASSLMGVNNLNSLSKDALFLRAGYYDPREADQADRSPVRLEDAVKSADEAEAIVKTILKATRPYGRTARRHQPPFCASEKGVKEWPNQRSLEMVTKRKTVRLLSPEKLGLRRRSVGRRVQHNQR
jgi:GGDEF domain-containing protein